jgi:hypothetical protein
MARTKTELEADFTQYRAIMDQVRSACHASDYQRAVELAISAWGSIDGMVQYERRYCNRKDHSTIESIDCVLRYAPLLFDFESLDKFAAFLKSRRTIGQNSAADFAQRLADARSLMEDALRLWNHLEQQGECRQDKLRSDLGGDQDSWRSMAETWERMGLIQRAPDGGSYRLKLTTQPDQQMRGKCPSCGVTGKAPQLRLLDTITCPKCHAAVHFVLMSESEV